MENFFTVMWLNPGLMTPGANLVFGGFFIIIAVVFYLVLRRMDNNDHES
ncbi:MAG: hypothetical protein H6632_01725 [Anaerolineales bacterium]|nr:hypothetical protein [Anaerolineales bacterium]